MHHLYYNDVRNLTKTQTYQTYKIIKIVVDSNKITKTVTDAALKTLIYVDTLHKFQPIRVTSCINLLIKFKRLMRLMSAAAFIIAHFTV